jgi:hypothetical protein
MRRVVFSLMVLAATASLVACGRAPIKQPDRGYNCIGIADDLKTLRTGDELPRVVQVLGMPDAASRTSSWFGREYDVLEYKVGENPCVKAVLHADEKGVMRVVFDGKGGYVGAGEHVYQSYRRTWFVSTRALMLDPVIFQP